MSASTSSPSAQPLAISIRPVRESDLDAADRIMRLAFGTFLGMPDPMKFMGDADYVRTRWRAHSSAVFGAEVAGDLVGTNFATRWGSVAFFGPLTIRPDLWNRGVAQALLRPTMDLFDVWDVSHAGLFTFASSVKHVSLYQKFGFWPRFLTCLMEFPLEMNLPAARGQWTQFSGLSADEKLQALKECRELTDSIYDGLGVESEIRAVDDQKLGDTLLVWDGSGLAGLAICHAGPGTEAGSGKCYVKFGAVRSGPSAAREFRRLIDACREFGASHGARTLTAGVNLARLGAYREMLQAGFRTISQGVAMERGKSPGYNRPDVFLIDDWR